MADYWKVGKPAEVRAEWMGATVTAATVDFTSLNPTTGAKEHLQADGTTWATGANTFAATANGADWFYKFVTVPASFRGREVDWEFTPTSVSALPKLSDCAYVTAADMDDIEASLVQSLAQGDVEQDPFLPL